MSSFFLLCKAWVPALTYMALIAWGSTDTFSGENTSGILMPLLHWLYPPITPEGVAATQLILRKCGHFFIYAGLALLFLRGVRVTRRRHSGRWRWSDAGIALFLATAYAMADEFHQSLVPSRVGSAWDVLLDASGALTALLAVWACKKLLEAEKRKRRANH